MDARGVMIPGLDPDPETDFQPFGDSKPGFGSSKKWNRNTSNGCPLSIPTRTLPNDV